MSKSSSAQNGWPRKVQIGSDTAVAFSYPQVRTINLIKVELDHLRNMRIYDSTELHTYELLNQNMTEQLSLKSSQLSDQSQQVTIYRDLATSYEGQNRKYQVQVARLKNQRTILGYSVVGLAAVIAGMVYFK